MAKQLLNVMPLEGAELPFLRRGGSGGGSAGAGGSYNVESIDNGDGTQTLAITDATGGGASGSSESPFFYVRYEYDYSFGADTFNANNYISKVSGMIGADCLITEDNIVIGNAIESIDKLPAIGVVIFRCAKFTMSAMVGGNRMVIEWNAETVKQFSSYITEITETEWNAEYNRILNL